LIISISIALYRQEPFAKTENPDHVIEYVGRYTHRVAIANHRILDLSHGKVAFSYKDRKKATRETMTIDAVEFIRRFLLHVLPKGCYHQLISDPPPTDFLTHLTGINTP
jgi:hypothetical protein